MEQKKLKLNQKGAAGVLLLLVVLVAAGIMIYLFSHSQVKLPGSNPQSNTSTEQGITRDKTALSDIVVDLDAQNGSNEVGMATITKSGSGVAVKIDLKSTPNSSQPAHIHVGACPNPGAIKYPLNPVVNGSSQTTLNVSLDSLKQSLPLAINVHKSDAEMKIYVSCGDIKP